MSDWRTNEKKVAEERALPWLSLEAWVIALGLGAITVWAFTALT